MQLRKGPNRVSFFGIDLLKGFAQPFADVFKLILKEIIVPKKSNNFLFIIAPALCLMPALPPGLLYLLSDFDPYKCGCEFTLRSSTYIVWGLWRHNSWMGLKL